MDPYECIKVLIDNLYDYSLHRTACDESDLVYAYQGVKEQADYLIEWTVRGGYLDPQRLTAVLARAIADHIEIEKESS